MSNVSNINCTNGVSFTIVMEDEVVFIDGVDCYNVDFELVI